MLSVGLVCTSYDNFGRLLPVKYYFNKKNVFRNSFYATVINYFTVNLEWTDWCYLIGLLII